MYFSRDQSKAQAQMRRVVLLVALCANAGAVPAPSEANRNTKAGLMTTMDMESDQLLFSVTGQGAGKLAMMNGSERPTTDPPVAGTSPAAKAPPPAPQSAGDVLATVRSPANDREFVVHTHANCRNRAYIMTSYLHQMPDSDCQRKCAMDSACTGYTVSRHDDGRPGYGAGECTVLKGSCDVMVDGKHDLYLAIQPNPENTQAVTQKTAAIPGAPATSQTVQQHTSQRTEEPAPGPAPMINVTIVIPTVRRFQSNGDPAPEHYLSPLVTKLWSELTPQQQKYVNFIILNSDKEPEKHVEALGLRSQPHVQVLNKPNWDAELEAQLRSTGSIHENGEVFLEDGRQVNMQWIKWVAAEDMDGAYLLELAMRQSPYVLFLEDDVQPTTNALAKLTQFVRSMTRDDWLFLDLYTPNLDWADGMLDVRNGERYNFVCCTQSMLFRSDLLPGIIQYWRTHPSEPVDDNLREYRQHVTPDRFIYAARPNLFEHVGAYSSNPQKSTGVVEHTSIEFYPLLFQTDEGAIADGSLTEPPVLVI